MNLRNTFLCLGLLSALCAFSGRALAEPSSLFWLSGTWNGLADYATVGGCNAAPADISMSRCGPARSAFDDQSHVDASALLLATDILLEVADKLDSKNKVKDAPIGKLLEQYDHVELLADARVAFYGRSYHVGVNPYRVSAQFLLHNPNLPLVSASLRQDSVVFMGGAWAVESRNVRFALGVKARYLHRKETIVEASVVDLASQARPELVFRQPLRGIFADFGANVEIVDVAHVSAQVRDVGRYTQGKDVSDNYLFIYSDHRTRFQGAFALVPKAPLGRAQLGVTHVSFIDRGPVSSDNSFLIFGYFLGPTHLQGSFAPGFFRTALSVTTNGFGLGLAQEWKNNLQSPQGSKPRFIAEMEVRL
jgi:hypothetical protein